MSADFERKTEQSGKPIIERAYFNNRGVSALKETQTVMADFGFGEIVVTDLLCQKYEGRRYLPEFEYATTFPDEETRRKFSLIFPMVSSLLESNHSDFDGRVLPEDREKIRQAIREIKDQIDKHDQV